MFFTLIDNKGGSNEKKDFRIWDRANRFRLCLLLGRHVAWAFLALDHHSGGLRQAGNGLGKDLNDSVDYTGCSPRSASQLDFQFRIPRGHLFGHSERDALPLGNIFRILESENISYRGRKKQASGLIRNLRCQSGLPKSPLKKGFFYISFQV